MSKYISKRYEIIKTLGHGGMADVYLALDRILDRTVAIKVLKDDMASDDISLERFKREAEASTHLSHPNIVEIYDVGDEGNAHYIVMEYVKGYTLKQLIKKRGPIAPRETVWMMKQLTSALLEAHKNGLIHRDIKSQNVLIKDDGTVKLADFGIAVLNNSIELTSKDTVVGSVHYIAPELVRGESASLSSDIYSLGIVMFETLTGDVPYKGDTPAAIALKHLKSTIPDVREINPDIPQSVSNIVIKATAKDPKERYQNPALMLKDLIDCLKPEHLNDKKLELESSKLVGKDFKSNISVSSVYEKNLKEKKKKKTVKRTNALLISSISMVAIIAVVFILGLSGFFRNKTSNITEVPDIIKMSLATAQDALDEREISIQYPINYVYTKEFEDGEIAEVKPIVGSQIEKGTKIEITISLGKFKKFDNYVGKFYDEVEKLFLDSKVIIDLETIASDENEPGIIVEQSLPEGEEYDPSTPITLVLKVVEPESINIPTDLKGRNVNVVKEELEELGLNVDLEVFDSTSLTDEERLQYNNYQVVEVSPAQGSIFFITKDSKVTLTYYFETPKESENKQ